MPTRRFPPPWVAFGRHERHDSAGMRLGYCRGGIGVREDGGTGAGLRVATNNITGERYIDHWTEAGFDCGIPIKNTGTGAAMMRISSQNGLRRPIALAGPGLGSRRRMSLAITGRPVDQDGRAGIAN